MVPMQMIIYQHTLMTYRSRKTPSIRLYVIAGLIKIYSYSIVIYLNKHVIV